MSQASAISHTVDRRGADVRHKRAPALERAVRARPRVAVVERHALVAEAIGLTLAASFEAIPVSLQSCMTTATARDAVLRARADVAVLVLTPGGAVDTLLLVEELSAQGVSVLVTGEGLDATTAERYLRAGAAASWSRGGIAAVVRAVTQEAERRACGHGASTPVRRTDVVTLSDAHDADNRTRRALASLTTGETRILWALMRGMSAVDIAHQHVVSVATVRTQIKQVLGKLGSRSQLAAVALAWRVDWTPGGDLGAA